MTMAVYPKFEDFFPEQTRPQISDLLATASSRDLLKATAFLNAQVHLKQRNLAAQEKIFYKWIRVFDEFPDLNERYTSFKHQVHASNGQVVLFTAHQLLQLTEQILLNFNDLPPKDSHDVADEWVQFKLWLLINSAGDEAVQEALGQQDGDIADMMLVNEADHYEFTGRKDFAYQTMLAHAFFEYLSENNDLQPYLLEFTTKKHAADYAEYLRHLVGTYAGIFTAESFGFSVKEGSEADIAFFDSFAYDLSMDQLKDLSATYSPDPDFKLIRTKPLIKEGPRQYYPLFHNFYVDKIYQGLLFDFYQLTSIQDKFKRFDNFLQHLGQEFAETNLFYRFLEGCFRPKSQFVAVPGNRYSDSEYSDYYIRDGNRLFLFEFKNSIIAAGVKHSADATQIKEAVFKKLVASTNDGKQQKKGINQLLSVLKTVANGGFNFDPISPELAKSLQIYPIIVHTDDFFSLSSVQFIVNEEFRKKFNDDPISAPYVHDVTLMHLKDILSIQFLARSGHLTIKEVMHQYKARYRIINQFVPQTPEQYQRHVFKKYEDFRSTVQDLIPEYADQEALMTRLTKALGLASS